MFKHVALHSILIEFFLSAVRHREQMLTLDVVFSFWVIWRNIEPVSSVPMSRQPWQKAQETSEATCLRRPRPKLLSTARLPETSSVV